MTSKREKKKKSIIYRGNFSKARDVDYLVTAVVFLARSVSTAALYLPVAALCLIPIGAMLGVLLLPAVLLLATVWSVTMHEITTASLFPSVSTYITYLIDHFLLISPILALSAFKPGSLGLLSQRAYAVPILLVYFTCAAFDIGLPQLFQAIPNTISWLAAAPTRISSALDAHSELKIRRTEVQLLREQVEEAHKKLAEAEAKARGEK
ncbi:hypothetical protein BCR35DRAFT_336190 [Leucosporidium creatinivorum]|uniref:Uncharacterized protein n=1 Tax=Leucosporidium creatinivorum TaxID=106004 RepID=A0A1Y2CJ84_9BASI|nr:hypothetical protein BCR35DRAFT_336190 [Leucosporidium creatinivorum]